MSTTDIVRALLLSIGDGFQFTITKHRLVNDSSFAHKRLDLLVSIGEGNTKTFSTLVPNHYHEMNEWLEITAVSFVNELQLKRKTTCP